MRGLTGIGGGLLTPNAVALLGINFPPGKQRNLAMGLFGAMAPVGAAGGSLVSGGLCATNRMEVDLFLPVWPSLSSLVYRFMQRALT